MPSIGQVGGKVTAAVTLSLLFLLTLSVCFEVPARDLLRCSARQQYRPVPHSNLKRVLPNSAKMYGLLGFTPKEWSS